MSAADRLAGWAEGLAPAEADRELARRALLDTVAVARMAADDPIAAVVADEPDAARWATLAHVLDYDDLHVPSTTHISAVCVPAALATAGGERAYLAGAGLMARIGTALGWPHYGAGWHATCTAGAFGAAATAAVALDLDRHGIATALALAIPAASGVQQSFGTQAKSLAVGTVTAGGVRAARLAASGANADPDAVDEWLRLVGGNPDAIDTGGPAVPGGLAIKLHPCCYALQRPIATVRDLGPVDASTVTGVRVETLESAIRPLIHAYPATGLEGKFSLQYGIAAALLDARPLFTDNAVRRPEATRLTGAVEVVVTGEGDGLLDGETAVTVELDDGSERSAARSDVAWSDAELAEKLGELDVGWDDAAEAMPVRAAPRGS